MATLYNASRTYPETVYAADGDSITISPGVTLDNVNDKFLWNLPRSVRSVGGKAITAAPVAVPTRTFVEASADTKDTKTADKA